MDQWFTVEQIDNTTFAISEYRHWEETHCYLLCGKGYSVLIDTGLGVSNIKQVAKKLTALPILVITTHVHWDHIGGHKWFDRIAVHESEQEWLSTRFPIPLQIVKNNLTKTPCEFPPEFKLEDYRHHHDFQKIMLYLHLLAWVSYFRKVLLQHGRIISLPLILPLFPLLVILLFFMRLPWPFLSPHFG